MKRGFHSIVMYVVVGWIPLYSNKHDGSVKRGFHCIVMNMMVVWREDSLDSNEHDGSVDYTV